MTNIYERTLVLAGVEQSLKVAKKIVADYRKKGMRATANGANKVVKALEKILEES